MFPKNKKFQKEKFLQGGWKCWLWFYILIEYIYKYIKINDNDTFFRYAKLWL